MDKSEILKKYFGHTDFREGQEKVIDSILSGRDVLAVMPTGSGKSVCYQLSAAMLEGITLVISPLISLMRDQVSGLIQTGIPAAYLNSSLTPRQFSKALSRAAEGAYKIIYVAPERLVSEAFINFAMDAPISLVTVDEAHCVSMWGQDFRPSYLKIASFVNMLAKRPVTAAFTATATRQVKSDIIQGLGLNMPLKITTGYNRENLYFGVEQPRNKSERLREILKQHSGESGIIYCMTRKLTDGLWSELKNMGYNVTRYHAGLSDKERHINQDDFIYDRKEIIVATNAFGMGIDKSDVRYVIHYNMPKDLESYYQEAGRAGRDGEKADCILLFGAQDIVMNKFLIDKSAETAAVDMETRQELKLKDLKRLGVMEQYCKEKGCLRRFILNYFGEALKDDCGNCSSCKKDFTEREITDEAIDIIRCIASTGAKYGMSVIRDILKGSENAKIKRLRLADNPSFGILKNLPSKTIGELIYTLIEKEVIFQTEGNYPILKLGDSAGLIENGHERVFMKVESETSFEEKKDKIKEDKPKNNKQDLPTIEIPEDVPILAEAEEENTEGNAADYKDRLYEELKNLRTKLSNKVSVPPYLIFSDRSLLDMCKKLPTDSDSFLNISGVGNEKLKRYGKAFTEAIRSFKEKNPDMTIAEYSEETDITRLVSENVSDDFISEEPLSMSGFVENIALRLKYTGGTKKLRDKFFAVLADNNAIAVGRDKQGRLVRDITPDSEKFGVIMVDKFSKNGKRYRYINITAKGQRFLLKNIKEE